MRANTPLAVGSSLDNTGLVKHSANTSRSPKEDPFSTKAVNPFPCFRAWFAEAEQSEPNDPNAMALATATPAGLPSVRMVLLKDVTRDSFVFYTNAESRKGQELQENPHAALCLHWKSLRRQVRVEGPLTQVSPAEADAYFHSRSHASQIGALASQQSRPLADRVTLEAQAAELAERYPCEVPRPPHWTGFAVFAERIEFWRDGPNRLHDRMLYERGVTEWRRTLLYP